MIISEDRCAAAALVEDRGRRDYVMFDDVGCLLDYQHGGFGGTEPVEVYVRDYGARRWVPAHAAHFLLAEPDRILTPMGSGIVAFAAPGDAAAKESEVGGRTLDYADLAEARRDWLREHHRGGPP